MTTNKGHLLAAPVRPADSADTFPTFVANEGKGGHFQVADIAARDAIPAERREQGMLCTTLDGGSGTEVTFQLIGGITNADWKSFASAYQKVISTALTSGVPTICDSVDLPYNMVTWDIVFLELTGDMIGTNMIVTHFTTGAVGAFGPSTGVVTHTIVPDENGMTSTLDLLITSTSNVQVYVSRRSF